ncbi:MAG TPA: TonB-dependent receptor [Chthoniobacteraceae bacterium]|nr:TonB-dependent receptor [Chthoniobacteraceae bacterium]
MVQLPEVVVTPTRNPPPETKLGSDFSLIDSAEITRTQSVNLEQAVDLTPGIFATQAGAFGGVPTYSIRGNRASDTLILLDGVPLNTEMFQSAQTFLTYAGTGDLDSIEIVRGPQSTLYGSEGIGGVVSMETKKGSGAPSADFLGEAGTFGSFREAVGAQGQIDKLSYSLYYERFNTENQRPNNALAVNRYSVRLDYQVADNLSLTLVFSGIDGHYEEPGSDRWMDYSSNDPSSHSIGQGNLLSAAVNWKVTDYWTQKLIFGTYFERYAFIDLPYAANFFTPTHYISDAVNYSVDWQNTFQIAHNNRLTAGMDFNELTGHDNTFNNQYLSDWAGYVQDEWEPVTHLNLTAGARYDGYELAGGAFTYRLTAAYLFPSDTKIRASYGTAFKAPSFLQLFSTSSFATGNSHLKPEKSRGWDAGVDQYLFNRHVTLGATFFQDRVRDLINFEQTSLVTGFYENEDSARNEGVELSADLNLCDNRWKTRLSYTWMDSTATDQGITQTRDELPRNDLSLDSSYLFCDKLTVGCGVSFVGGRVDTDYSTFPSSQVKLQDYWTARVYTRYDINDHFSIFARIENVTNTQYQDALGYPGLPIGFYAGAQIKF